jgi:hypothetical protein
MAIRILILAYWVTQKSADRVSFGLPIVALKALLFYESPLACQIYDRHESVQIFSRFQIPRLGRDEASRKQGNLQFVTYLPRLNYRTPLQFRCRIVQFQKYLNNPP